jgi:adenylate cyclase
MLQILWNTIAYTGVSRVPDTSEHKHIVLINILALIVSFFVLLNLPVIFVAGSNPIFALVSAVYSCLLLFTIALNGSGRSHLARMYFTLLSALFLITDSVLVGSQANFHYFLISEILAIFFIFPGREKRTMGVLVFLMAAAFVALQVSQEFHNGFLHVPEDVRKVQAASIDIGAGILIIAFGYYIRSTYRTAELYLEAEQHKSQKLLLNILPESIVRKLRESPDTIAERFDHCTVLFSDIVGFTGIAKKMSAVEVVSLLNEIFSAFDDLAEQHGLEKIKTIGDAYMVVGGLPEPDAAHAEKVARFAIDMLGVVKRYRDENDVPLELRVGINTGAAVAGVIGKKKFIYDLWGDSVNTASRMESHGIPGQIQVTESTYALIKDKFNLELRGEIEVKGLGFVKSYLLQGAG